MDHLFLILYDLYDIAHVAGWDSYKLHGEEHAFPGLIDLPYKVDPARPLTAAGEEPDDLRRSRSTCRWIVRGMLPSIRYPALTLTPQPLPPTIYMILVRCTTLTENTITVRCRYQSWNGALHSRLESCQVWHGIRGSFVRKNSSRWKIKIKEREKRWRKQPDQTKTTTSTNTWRKARIHTWKPVLRGTIVNRTYGIHKILYI